MSKGLFITGTDTEIGKTTTAIALMQALQKMDYKVAAMKPVSSGCRHTPEGLRNQDALQLNRCSSVDLPYDLVNPFAFEPPVSPNIAAKEAGIPINENTIINAYQQVSSNANIIIVEGIGGWLVPVDQRLTMADIAKSLSLPVILVVGIKLGCLNHALLTAESILAKRMPLAGWVANCLLDDTDFTAKNIDYLCDSLPAPCLGSIPYISDGNFSGIDEQLQLESLVNLLEN